MKTVFVSIALLFTSIGAPARDWCPEIDNFCDTRSRPVERIERSSGETDYERQMRKDADLEECKAYAINIAGPAPRHSQPDIFGRSISGSINGIPFQAQVAPNIADTLSSPGIAAQAYQQGYQQQAYVNSVLKIAYGCMLRRGWKPNVPVRR